MQTEIRIDNDDESILPEGEYKIEVTRVTHTQDKIIFFVHVVAERVNIRGLRYWKYNRQTGV